VNEVADAAKLALSWEEQTEILLDLDPDCAISSQQATAVGLVIGEAITNAIKYSHPGGVPGKIKIMCRRNKGGGLVITGHHRPWGFQAWGFQARLKISLRDRHAFRGVQP
jgi:two-component sensor histidine kinase